MESPADKLQKIFEEFYQIEPPNTRHYGGLGIGLTIAKGLIEAQGGKIWAESAGYRQRINVQGVAADGVTLALTLLHKRKAPHCLDR